LRGVAGVCCCPCDCGEASAMAEGRGFLFTREIRPLCEFDSVGTLAVGRRCGASTVIGGSELAGWLGDDEGV
jgi:hypothetical protein